MLHQAASFEVTLIRHRNDIEENMWRTHQHLIDSESRINIELSTSNRCHSFQVDSPFIIGEISADFQHGILMSNRQRVDKDAPIGYNIFQSILIICNGWGGGWSSSTLM